jgi:signal transduction histidine kinase
LEEILEQTRRIDRIVQSLVTFSHGGGPDGERWELFDLADCVADAQRLVKLSRGGKQVCHTQSLEGRFIIRGDRQRMQQVVVNLLTNACDAVVTGGQVRVSARARNDTVILTVDDDGPGIPEEFRDRVFEPFFTTKEPGEGTGLGLPLAYSIVHDHGGSIQIDCGPNGGTCVTLTLPAHEATEAGTG